MPPSRPRPKPARTDEDQAKSIGNEDTGSRAKAKAAHDRTEGQQPSPQEIVPLNVNGRPMHKISMCASELIPTGQYANVSIGPATVTAYVDPDRVVGEGESYFSDDEASTIVAAMNQLAEIVEVEVLAVQRNLVLESLQNNVTSGS